MDSLKWDVQAKGPRHRSRAGLVFTVMATLGAWGGWLLPVCAATNGAPAEPPPAVKASSPHTTSWGAKLKHAGTVGIVQFGLSAFGAIFIFERFFGLRRKHLAPAGLSDRARQMWKEGKFAELEALGDTDPSTLARVISFIVKNRHSPLAEVSQIAGELTSRELAIHHQRASPLGVVATLEPLLGLLGMIFGMITTFETVAMAGSLGDATQLAAGISEALVTTGLGLAFAIPFLALYHYFRHRTNSFGVQLEGELTSLLTEWFMQPREP